MGLTPNFGLGFVAGAAYTAHQRNKQAKRAAKVAAKDNDSNGDDNSANLIPTISAYSLDIEACRPDDPARLAIIKKVYRIQRSCYSCVAIAMFSLLITPIFLPALAVILVALFAAVYLNYASHIKLPDAAIGDPVSYDLIQTLWQKLDRCTALWCIKSHKDLPPDKCESEHVADRDDAFTTQKLPYYMRMHGKPMGLFVGDATLYFMPDVIFVVMNGLGKPNYGSGYIPYNDLKIDAELITQIEHKKIRDAVEVKRLGDAPIYQYGKITFSTRSDNRLHIELITSSMLPVFYLKETTDKLEAEQGAKAESSDTATSSK